MTRIAFYGTRNGSIEGVAEYGRYPARSSLYDVIASVVAR